MLVGLLGLEWPGTWQTDHLHSETFGNSQWVDHEVLMIKNQAPTIDTRVLRLSLNAYVKARKQGLDKKELLTVIDYSKPSTEKRLWVFDLKHGRTLFNTWVSHGKNTGGIKAQHFSNNPGSLQSSLGVFVTDSDPYEGGNGYSLRLHGLEKGVNDKAYQRDIVIHGAWYVNADTIRRFGAIGRSWGCPAVSPALVKSLIDTIKQNTLIFAYYPDKKWLSHSQFLTA